MIQKIKNTIQIIRLPNLLMLAYTQYLTRYFLFPYVVSDNKYTFFLTDIQFVLLVLSTILIAAAGYIINDYYDEQADAINKPHKPNINHILSEKKINLLYYTLNIAASIMALYIAININAYKLISFHLICIILLWLYSTQYKHKIIIGNIIVALLCAIAIFMVWIFEFYAFKQSEAILNIDLKKLNLALWGFMLFAFLLTLMREMIKDIEDIEGDHAAGSLTLPIVYGVTTTKVGVIIIAILSVLILIFSHFYYNNLFSVWLHAYMILAIELPLLFVITLLQKKYSRPSQFRFWSWWLKAIMFTGISAMWFF